MAKAPSEKDKERAHELAMKKWDVILSSVKWVAITTMVVGGIAAAIAAPVYFSSGKQTSIRYVVNWIQDVKLHVWLAWGTAGAGWALARMYRNKLLKERSEKDARIAALEKQLDPSRTSSGLLPDGRAQKGQK